MQQNSSSCFIGIWNYHLAPSKSKSRIFPGPYPSPLCTKAVINPATVLNSQVCFALFHFYKWEEQDLLLIKMLQSSLLSPLDKAIKSALWTCLLIWHDRNWLCKRHKNALHFLLANSSEPSVEQVGLNEIE